tara:strand:+ start:5431 stop:6315 length:885 start_codon:yes stop_codon:yes gene_type:complete
MLLKEYIKEIILLEKTSPYFKHFFDKKPLEAYAIFYDQRKLLEYFKNDETSYHGYNFFDFLKNRIETGIENMSSDELNIGKSDYGSIYNMNIENQQFAVFKKSKELLEILIDDVFEDSINIEQEDFMFDKVLMGDKPLFILPLVGDSQSLKNSHTSKDQINWAIHDLYHYIESDNILPDDFGNTKTYFPSELAQQISLQNKEVDSVLRLFNDINFTEGVGPFDLCASIWSYILLNGLDTEDKINNHVDSLDIENEDDVVNIKSSFKQMLPYYKNFINFLEKADKNSIYIMNALD